MFIIFTKILSEIFSENFHLLPGFVSAAIGFGVRRARFLPRFTSGQKQMVLDFVLILRKNPLNNFSGLCQFCLLLYVSTICNTVFECFIFTFQSNGQNRPLLPVSFMLSLLAKLIAGIRKESFRPPFFHCSSA